MKPEDRNKTAETVRNDEHCFCCGKKNERGLKLSFVYPSDGKASTSLEIPTYFTGWEELTHGGLISMLLDETMAHSCISRGMQGVTAELTVRFKQPLPVGTMVFVEGEAAETKGRVIRTEAKIHDQEGKLYAQGSAKFIVTA